MSGPDRPWEAVLFDFDGTLAPIVERPEDAVGKSGETFGGGGLGGHAARLCGGSVWRKRASDVLHEQDHAEREKPREDQHAEPCHDVLPKCPIVRFPP